MKMVILIWIISVNLCTALRKVHVTGNNKEMITCEDDEIISIYCVSFNEHECDSNSGSKCISDILTVYTNCNGYKHCEVSKENFTTCRPRRPKSIKVEYECRFTGSDSLIGTIVVSVLIPVTMVTAIAVCIKKFRYGKGRKSELSRNITPNHYHLATNTSVPTNKETNKDNYFVVEEKETEKEESHYMSTKEGVYDISNERRHKMAEKTEIYDRSVSGVYDETNHKQTKDDVATIYDNSNGDVYDKAVHGPKESDDTNELYETCEIKVRREDGKHNNEV